MSDFPLPSEAVYESVGANTSISGGVSVVSGTGNTKGSWVQVIASTSRKTDSFILNLVKTTTGGSSNLFDIAIGAGGSEQIIVPDLFVSKSFTACYEIWLPRTIPKNSRIAIRQQSSTSNTTWGAHINLISNGLSLPVQNGRVFSYGVNTGDSGGVSVDPGGTINTKGAWSEITASSDVLRGFIVPIGFGTNTVLSVANWLMDIAVGGSGSEQIIVENLQLAASSQFDFILPQHTPFFNHLIPSGTRLAIRAQCNISDATDRLLDVSIVGFG